MTASKGLLFDDEPAPTPAASVTAPATVVPTTRTERAKHLLAQLDQRFTVTQMDCLRDELDRFVGESQNDGSLDARTWTAMRDVAAAVTRLSYATSHARTALRA
jgi:hypothetical protein